jgi:hypothetical protein
MCSGGRIAHRARAIEARLTQIAPVAGARAELDDVGETVAEEVD